MNVGPEYQFKSFLLTLFISLFYGSFYLFGFFNDLIDKYYVFIGFLFILALFSNVIILPSFGQKKSEFVVRFLIMITFQMLFMMSVLLYESYVFKNSKEFVFHQLIIFIAYLIFHSLLMIKIQKKQVNN
tara:strand:+ start:520 stop:906 length:387 start_codon:yes stop_codon:yes gene_type:complete